MKHELIWKAGVLGMMLALSAGAACAQEAEPAQETEMQTGLQAEIKDRERPTSNAVVNGQVLDILDEAYYMEDASAEHRWIVLADGTGKGFGCPWIAMNLDKEIEIEAEEGAEVYLGSNGILRFEWRDTESNEPVNTGSLFFMVGDTPITAALYAQHYDWEGKMTEESEVLTYTQREDGDYYAEVSPAVQQLVSEWGSTLYHTNNSPITFQDENGDAVGYGPDGTEIIRYAGEDATKMMGNLSADGKILCVYFWMKGKTELFEMN